MAALLRASVSGLGHVVLLLCLGLALTSMAPGSGRVAAAQDDDEDVAANAVLRIVHAVPGGPEIDVLIDGQPLAEAVPYGSATDYVPIAPGDHLLQVVPTGQPAESAVIEQELGAEPARAYIFVALGQLNEIEGRVFEVDLGDLEPGNARARVINATTDAGGVDLAVTGGDSLFDDIGFGDGADYADIAPGSYSFDLRGEDDRVIGTVPDILIEEARVYDIVALGQEADQTLNVLALVSIASPPCTEVLGLEGTSEDACVRVVHAAPGSGAVDVYVNDSPLITGLDFGTATEYVALPSGEGRAVRVTAAETPIEEAIIEVDIALEAGQAYEILATGEQDNLEVLTSGVDLRPVPEDQARFRVIHASPDAGGVDVAIEEGATLSEGIDFRGIAEYIAIDEGEYTIQVRVAGEQTVALSTELAVEPGTVYDVVAVGRLADETLALLVLTAPVPIREGAVATPGSDVTGAGTPAAAAATVEGLSTSTPEDEDAMAETVVGVDTGTATPAP